jgi:hypothetical protein
VSGTDTVLRFQFAAQSVGNEFNWMRAAIGAN